MADPVREMRGAEQMVMRLLVSTLWEEFLLSRDEPVAALNEISNRMLSSLDTLTDKGGASELFDQTSLHEMETFWKGVQQKVEKIAEIRNRD